MKRTSSRIWKQWDEFAAAQLRVHPPSVSVDNSSSSEATIIVLNSANRHGVRVGIVHSFAELKLKVIKATMTTDSGWFVDVFHLTKEEGGKIEDAATLTQIHQVLEGERPLELGDSWEVAECPEDEQEYGIIEIQLESTERPGLVNGVRKALLEQGFQVKATGWQTCGSFTVLVIIFYSWNRRCCPTCASSTTTERFITPTSTSYGTRSTICSRRYEMKSSKTRHNLLDIDDCIDEVCPQTQTSCRNLHNHLLAIREALTSRLRAESDEPFLLLSVKALKTASGKGELDMETEVHRVLAMAPARAVARQEEACSEDGGVGYEATNVEHSFEHFSLLWSEDVRRSGHTSADEEDEGAAPRVREEDEVEHPCPTSPRIGVTNDIYQGSASCAAHTCVAVECADRQCLLFDMVCALFYLELQICHATLGVRHGVAYSEFLVCSQEGKRITCPKELQRLRNYMLQACKERSLVRVEIALDYSSQDSSEHQTTVHTTIKMDQSLHTDLSSRFMNFGLWGLEGKSTSVKPATGSHGLLKESRCAQRPEGSEQDRHNPQPAVVNEAKPKMTRSPSSTICDISEWA
ncbi:hypothetical protein CYMTET_8099 [Cymbomonas tetramitiformis]|uniref:ACT domain-containing protein n=1 Tax=Cymbomonas tetramitiformis TaxID=36881 RepID=A0AAE0LGT9_9CHLO|nr:hypothetical protein CYMTET_8099 [Cymbomonas tetramitiformis]